MGSERFYPEEAPKRCVKVAPFWMDEVPVTNEAFNAFVAATGYRTVAETPPDPSIYRDMLPELAVPGSAVFNMTAGPVPIFDPRYWWSFVIGASWRHPLGPNSSTAGIENHPVVHVTYRDAKAFADWAGKSLPTEAEWEFAARGGLDQAEYAWGDTLAPDGRMLANYWQGTFPRVNLATDDWERTSPVRYYPANPYGLYDMIGNVWEWTADWYAAPNQERKAKRSCCTPVNPRGPRRDQSYDPISAVRIPRKVLKGGSHLCAANYCQRYRPAARHPQPIDTSTSHIGFRCVIR